MHIGNASHRPSVCHRPHRDYFVDWWLNGAAYVWRSVTTGTAYTAAPKLQLGAGKETAVLDTSQAFAPSTAP